MKKLLLLAAFALGCISASAQKTLTLSTYKGTDLAKYDGQTLNVSVSRYLFTGWNTISLPFAMSEDQVNEVFGSDCKLEKLVGVENDGVDVILNFQDCKKEGIKANTPYILNYTGENGTKQFTTENALIVNGIASLVFTAEGTGEKITMAAAQQQTEPQGLYGILAKDNSEAAFVNASETANGFYATRCYVKMENGNAGYASLSAVTLTNTPVGNSTTSTSSSTTTKTTASSQRNHMEFLGLEMGGNPAQFIQALRQKGFKDGSGFSQDKTQVFLSGMVYGMQSEICVYTENNRVNSVSIINMVNSKTAAINRCNRFKKEMATTYGTGAKWKTLYEGAAELKLPYGTAKYQYGMFDSGVYELSMYIIDTNETAPASQQNNETDMMTVINNQISAAKKKVQEAPTSENYYQLANILYHKFTKINDDSEKKNILIEIDNIYKTIIDKYPNTSATAVVGRATIVNIFNPDIKQGVAKPLYEKYLQMIEPKIKNKTYNDEEKNGYLAACWYMYKYYLELSNFKQVKNYLKKYDAVDPGNENIRKMLEMVKDF